MENYIFVIQTYKDLIIIILWLIIFWFIMFFIWNSYWIKETRKTLKDSINFRNLHL